jgi:cytochrome P450
MSLHDVLLDASIFEQPTQFRPDRWLAENPDHSRINKFHVPFGRGSRMCIGLNLAMAEHYLVLGSMFRRFDVDLYETTRERDVDTAQDCFLGEPAQDSPGIRVKLRPVPGLRDFQVMRTDV